MGRQGLKTIGKSVENGNSAPMIGTGIKKKKESMPEGESTTLLLPPNVGKLPKPRDFCRWRGVHRQAGSRTIDKLADKMNKSRT